MRHGFGDLIVALGDVGRTENVADVAHLQRFAQIHAQLEVVGGVERGNAANSLRTEARAGAIGGPDIERHAQEGDVILAHFSHVLQIVRLQERVDAGPVRQFSALEATDLGLVLNGVDALQAELFAAANFFLPLANRNRCFLLQRPHAFHLAEIGQRTLMVAMTRRVSFIK